MIELYDRHGNKLASGPLRDGEVLRVPYLLMDGAPPDIAAITRAALSDSQAQPTGMHRPGAAVLTDADRDARESARDQRKAKLSDAWRNPSPVAAHIEKHAPTTPTGDAAARRDARLRDAWRGGN